MTPTLIAPAIPFPNIYWWSKVFATQKVIIDQNEHFEKMSFRNRYLIVGANGIITLSIPIAEGRQQRKAMKDVFISDSEAWQKQHWRSIQTAYNRSPYFEFFETEIQKLYTQSFEKLSDFSIASIEKISALLHKKLDFQFAENYEKHYPEDFCDIRNDFRSKDYLKHSEIQLPYHQTFEERLGFLPNLSILDLLFAEGKNAITFLKK